VSFIRTSLIAVLAVGLGLYIYFFEAPKMLQEAKGDHIVDVEAAQIEHIRLTYPAAKPVELVKMDGTWRLLSPIDAAADANQVDQFITALRDATIERRIPKDEAENLKSYGLDTDTGTQGRLELTLAGGRTLPAIVVGNTTPVDFHAFVRVEGKDEVLLTPLIFHTSIKKTGFDFRNKTLLHVDPQAISRLTLDKPGQKIVLERKGDDWTLLSPTSDRADAETARGLVSTLPTIEAIAYFDGPEVNRPKFGLDAPSLTVTADVTGAAPVSFKLGTADEEPPAGTYFERGSDAQVAKVAAWAPTSYGIGANDVRDRRLVRCKASDVVRMTFTRDGDTFTLVREANGKPWSIEPAGEGSVVQRIADNELMSLVELKGDKLVGDATDTAGRAAYGLDKPLGRVELSTKAGLCGAISGGSKAPGVAEPEYFLQSDDRSAVLAASTSQMSRLSLKRPEFVEMKVPAAKVPGPATEKQPDVPSGEPSGTDDGQAPAGQ